MKISQVSKLTNTPASTIRDYEALAFIEPTIRSTSGYRVFNKRHILQIKLCRLVFREFINKHLRRASLQVLYAATQGDMPLCHQYIEEYIASLEAEIKKANEAIEIIKKWISPSGKHEEKTGYTLKMAAECIGTTKETIRNWERNGLLLEKFTPYQRRIYKASDIERMKLIYMLAQTGYSIMAIYKYFSALSHCSHNALQVLIDPDTEDDLFSIQDRWLQALISAKADGIQMLAIISVPA